MPVRTDEFRERCRELTDQLGGDHIAARAAHAIVSQMDIDTVEGLRSYYEQAGPVVFAYEVSDLRNVGSTSAARITDLAASPETVN